MTLNILLYGHHSDEYTDLNPTKFMYVIPTSEREEEPAFLPLLGKVAAQICKVAKN